MLVPAFSPFPTMFSAERNRISAAFNLSSAKSFNLVRVLNLSLGNVLIDSFVQNVWQQSSSDSANQNHKLFTMKPDPMIIRFSMLNPAEHEISILDKSHLIKLLRERSIYRNFHCFCPSNQTFKFDFLYNLKHQ